MRTLLRSPARTLEVATPFHRLQHGNFVRIFKIGADRNSDADPRDTHAQWLDQLGNVHSRSLAFRGRVGGHDDLFHAPSFEAFDETLQFKLVRTDAVERR